MQNAGPESIVFVYIFPLCLPNKDGSGILQLGQKPWKMTETLANGYSYESTQQELSNAYQHARVCPLTHMLQEANLGKYKMMQNPLENDRNPGKWVLIWEFSARAFQWIPTRQGLDDFRESLRSCALDESINHSIERDSESFSASGQRDETSVCMRRK